jgi:Bacteriophage HK97-gp10, putative tail-component
MPLVTVELSGLDTLQAKINAWKAAAESGLKAGVLDAAARFEGAAKANAPVLTGRLRDGIHTETVTDTPQTQVLAVTPTVEAANKYGFEPPYARRIEYGFVGADSLGRNYHQAAQPYMRPAFDTEQSGAAGDINNGITDALEEVG